MPSEGLPRTERLRKRVQFTSVQNQGRKLHTHNFLVFVRPHRPSDNGPDDGPAPTRLGVTVTRKLGGAVVRNRVKRLVREAFRRHKGLLPAGLDIVFVAKRGADELEAAQVVEELETLCKRQFGR